MCFVFIDHVDMSQYHTIHHNPKLMNIPTLKPFCSFLYSSWGFHVFLHIWTHWHITGRDRKMFFVSLLWPKERSVYENPNCSRHAEMKCCSLYFFSFKIWDDKQHCNTTRSFYLNLRGATWMQNWNILSLQTYPKTGFYNQTAELQLTDTCE